jgi:hypothetical protein
MPPTNARTARKAGFTTGYVALATLMAEYVPGLKDLPMELTIPILAGLINAAKNILKHRFKVDLFGEN